MNVNKRKSNFELLRLVAMMMVITVHYIGWGGAANNTEIGEVNFFIAGILAVLSQVCVNCFYLISGYFLKTGENINWKKGIEFWCVVVFYSIIVPIILVLSGYLSKSDIKITNILFPIITNQYWFASIFLIIILVSPLVGKMILTLSEKQIRNLLIVLILFESFQPMFFHNATGEMGYGILHAITMVIIGNYIRRINFSFKKSWMGMVIYFISIGIGAFINIGWLIFFGERNKIILDYNSPVVIIASVALFVFFKQLKFQNTIVNKISPYIFAVYLINDNSYMRSVVYTDILHSDNFYHNEYFVIHYILSVFSFMLIGFVVDIIREKIFKLLNINGIAEELYGRFNGNYIDEK